MFKFRPARSFYVFAFLFLGMSAHAETGPEVIVLTGPEEVIEWLQAEQWWGEVRREGQRTSPHAMLTGINPGWQKSAAALTVPDKKALFYRVMAPLVLHANTMVMARREQLGVMARKAERGEALEEAEITMLRRIAGLTRIRSGEEAALLSTTDPALPEVIEQALYRLDVVPAGLALGQAAYESGYGTSRFAVGGNALFGQWTFGGEGLVPEQQRKELGDHRIASFDWPFDSVRGYFLNLSSHPAYEPFRRLRADLRARGEPLTSLVLADGLINYSERGQEYVDTLKGIIRVNGLDVADNAVLRDEPIRYLVAASTQEDAAAIRQDIDEMRGSGELSEIIARMQLE